LATISQRSASLLVDSFDEYGENPPALQLRRQAEAVELDASPSAGIYRQAIDEPTHRVPLLAGRAALSASLSR
jgi:hypothetical protein